MNRLDSGSQLPVRNTSESFFIGVTFWYDRLARRASFVIYHSVPEAANLPAIKSAGSKPAAGRVEDGRGY